MAMGLIRSTSLMAPATGFSMRDIEQNAAEVLRDAQAQAERIKQSVRTEAEEAGWQEGYTRGLQEGRSKGRTDAWEQSTRELSGTIEALAQAAGELACRRRQWESEILADVVELAMAVARRITRRQAMLDPAVLAANLESALKLVTRKAQMRIAIHPEQRRILDEAMKRLRLDFPALADTTIVEDSSIAPGGCRVFTEGGCIDADIDSQLDRIIADVMPQEVAR
jgi:flagellar assembly protein FliH